MVRKRKISKFFDILAMVLFIIVIIILAIGMIFGGSKLIDNEFIKYLATSSFILAGLTFYAIFNKKIDNSIYYLIYSSRCLILAGFFFIAYLLILNIEETQNLFLNILKIFTKAYVILGSALFVVGIVTLIIILEIIVNKTGSSLYEKDKKK